MSSGRDQSGAPVTPDVWVYTPTETKKKGAEAPFFTAV